MTAGGQLEKVVARETGSASAPMQRRGVGTAFRLPLPPCPGDGWQSPTGNRLLPRVGQGNAAGLEGGAESGADSLKGVFVQDFELGWEGERAESELRSGGWGSETSLPATLQPRLKDPGSAGRGRCGAGKVEWTPLNLAYSETEGERKQLGESRRELRDLPPRPLP